MLSTFPLRWLHFTISLSYLRVSEIISSSFLVFFTQNPLTLLRVFKGFLAVRVCSAGAGLATTLVRRHVLLHLHHPGLRDHHDQASLLGGKLHAILQRSYLKGRDLYPQGRLCLRSDLVPE